MEGQKNAGQKTSLTTAQYERSRVNKQKAKNKLAQKKRQGAMVLLPCAVEQKNKPTYPKQRVKTKVVLQKKKLPLKMFKMHKSGKMLLSCKM